MACDNSHTVLTVSSDNGLQEDCVCVGLSRLMRIRSW